MGENAHGEGHGRPQMTRAQWEQHLESELATRKYEIALYEAGNIQRALAESRREGTNDAAAELPAPRLNRPAHWRAAQGAQQGAHHAHPQPIVQPMTAHPQPHGPGPKERAKTQRPNPGMAMPMPHGLPLQQPAYPHAHVPLAMNFADSHVDMTALSDTEAIKSVRVGGPPPEAPFPQLAPGPRMFDSNPDAALPRQQGAPRMDGPTPDTALPQKQGAPRMDGPTPDTALSQQQSALRMDAPISEVLLPQQQQHPLVGGPTMEPPILQQHTQSRLGMQLDKQIATGSAAPTALQASSRVKTVLEKKLTSLFEPSYKEFPTILRDPDSEGFVELRCPVCGGNASAQHNMQGRLKHFTGASGVRSHHRICHPSTIVEGEVQTLQDVVRNSTHRKLSVDEVNDMLAKTAGTYAIGHFLAAASEPNAKIRGPREQKPQKPRRAASKVPTKKRSRTTAIKLKAPAKKQPSNSEGNDFVYDKVDAEMNQDDEDDDLPTKKHTRRR